MNIKVFILNCTLKSSPQVSNTEALIKKATTLYQTLDTEVEVLRAVDYNIKPGTSSDEGPDDEWPLIFGKIKECDIFILATPIWVGRLCSIGQRVIERLDSLFHEKELLKLDTGQYITYGKVAGIIITGNEDGAYEVAAHVLWAMQEFGFTVPPNANTYWVGMAGPGPSYMEAKGERYLYTNKLLRYLIHNTVYFANLLKHHPIPTNLNELAQEAQKESDS